MGYKNRYVFIKRTYPNTVVIFKNRNNKYIGYSNQKDFLKYIEFKRLNNLSKLKINYIVISNMQILEHKTFEENNYELYYARFSLFKLVNYFRQHR